MNRESFNDNDVAEVLNRDFVPIKVDREERPDIDSVYMTFAQAMNGNGGWPLNILATPEGKPFYVGTYFPKKTSGRMIGIVELLNKLNNLWSKDNDKVLEDSNHILREVKKYVEDYKSEDIDDGVSKAARESLESIYDEEYGGFGSSPKFPMPQYLLFLLNYGELTSDSRAIEIAEDTLIKMYKGGLFDHIGYGFFRYSVDDYWLVPHFEKMLYDNALLSLAYTKAFEITNKEIYREIAEKTYEFIIRDMLSENGGFYSALDADSEGIEGKFYLFNHDETINLLGEEWGTLYNKYYDITEKGNFEGSNIPNLIKTDLDKIDKKDMASLNSINQMLFTYREKRIMPHRDDKILTSWNGLMIGSLSNAGILFKNNFYIKKAKEAIDFLITKSIDSDGNLLSTYIDGVSYNHGYLEDYTFFIYGLINVYKATMDNKYLDLAKKLVDDMMDLFGEDDHKGLFFYGHNSEELVLRPKEAYDGAIPSGNGFAVLDLMDLYVITKEEKYANLAKEILHAFGKSINDNPLAHLYSLVGIKNFI